MQQSPMSLSRKKKIANWFFVASSSVRIPVRRSRRYNEIMKHESIVKPFLDAVIDPSHRAAMIEVLTWIEDTFPQLKLEYKWHQAMFTDHGTFIIGFSVAQKHFAVALEKYGLDTFRSRLRASGYEDSSMLFRIRFDQTVDYGLLGDMIRFNVNDKASCRTFWRP